MYRNTTTINSNLDERNSRNNLNQDIPEYGSAFVCGKSRFEAEKFHVKNDPIVSISCGDEHTGVVTETGRVFMFGSNNWGQLGLGHENNVDKPSCIKSIKHEKVQLICCGRNHTLLATESGHLYSFGCNSESQLGLDKTDSFFNTPQKISLSANNWKMLSAGAGHSCALTDDGSLYVWGINDNGELGIGSITEQPVPKKIDLGFKIKFVSCGYYHTAIISKTGKLYTAGSNEYFQLGRDRNEKKFNEVEGVEEHVKHVSCGGGHTLFATDDGVTYAIGDGSKGQLGLGPDMLKTKYPKRIKALEKFSIAKISSGECHSAFITNKGEILTCGDNRYGKLGLNQKLFNSIQYQPILVEKYQDLDVKLVACGGCHMILVGFLINSNLGDENDDEDEYLNKYSKSKNFLKQKVDSDYLGSKEYSSRTNNDNLINSARGKVTPLTSSSRLKPLTNSDFMPDSDNERNPEMEYTFNRTHTLTKDDRFVPLSQTDLRKYARDDYTDQYKSKKNSDYSKSDRFTSSMNQSKLKKSKYDSSSSSTESLKEQRYSSRTHTNTTNNNIKNDNFTVSNKYNRNNDYDSKARSNYNKRIGNDDDDDDDNYNYRSNTTKSYSNNKNKLYEDDDVNNKTYERPSSKLDKKEETTKKKPFKICTIL